MSVKNLESVKRNALEIITESELSRIMKKNRPVTYVGYETSGPVHIGHWVSIKKLLDMQEAGFHVKVLWADLHTYLNRKGSLEWIEETIKYWQLVFEALGLKAEYIKGSSFQESRDYFQDVLRMSLNSTVKRGLRSMQEIARSVEDARISQIIYPLMQALDISYLGVDVAIGGMEQRKVHMIAREILPKIGYKKPCCLHHEIMVSLRGEGKMSSSKPESMFALHETPEVIRERIKNAYCPPAEENNPVLQMARIHIFGGGKSLKIERDKKYGGDLEIRSYEELLKVYVKDKELHALDLKAGVAEAVIEALKPVREAIKRKPEVLRCLT